MDAVIPVLIADDSEDDRWFLRRAFQQVSTLKLIAEVEDGEQAIKYLSGAGPYADRREYPFPRLLLSDLKMPKMGGFDLLKWLQAQSFPDLRVVVLTNSSDQADIAKSLALGADYFQRKPGDINGLVELVKWLETFMVMFNQTSQGACKGYAAQAT